MAFFRVGDPFENRRFSSDSGDVSLRSKCRERLFDAAKRFRSSNRAENAREARFLRFSRSIDFEPRADDFLKDRVAFSRRSQHPSTFDRRSRPLFGKSSFFSKTKRPAHLPIFRRPLGLIFSRLLRSFRCKDRFENFSAILHSDLAFRLAYGSQPLSPSPLFSARRLRRLFAPFCSNFSLGQRSHRCWLRFTPEHCGNSFFLVLSRIFRNALREQLFTRCRREFRIRRSYSPLDLAHFCRIRRISTRFFGTDIFSFISLGKASNIRGSVVRQKLVLPRYFNKCRRSFSLI